MQIKKKVVRRSQNFLGVPKKFSWKDYYFINNDAANSMYLNSIHKVNTYISDKYSVNLLSCSGSNYSMHNSDFMLISPNVFRPKSFNNGLVLTNFNSFNFIYNNKFSLAFNFYKKNIFNNLYGIFVDNKAITMFFKAKGYLTISCDVLENRLAYFKYVFYNRLSYDRLTKPDVFRYVFLYNNFYFSQNFLHNYTRFSKWCV